MFSFTKVLIKKYSRLIQIIENLILTPDDALEVDVVSFHQVVPSISINSTTTTMTSIITNTTFIIIIVVINPFVIGVVVFISGCRFAPC